MWGLLLVVVQNGERHFGAVARLFLHQELQVPNPVIAEQLDERTHNAALVLVIDLVNPNLRHHSSDREARVHRVVGVDDLVEVVEEFCEGF